MGRARLGLVVALALAVALLGWQVWNARSEVQVPATFGRLAEALSDNDAAAVVACMHPDYDWRGQWPELYARQEQAREVLGNGPELSSPRGLAQAGLKRVLALHVLNRLVLSWRITAVEERPDGLVVVKCDLGLDAPNGSLAAIRPPAEDLHFTLKRYGILGRYRILRHDPIPVRTPNL